MKATPLFAAADFWEVLLKVVFAEGTFGVCLCGTFRTGFGGLERADVRVEICKTCQFERRQ